MKKVFAGLVILLSAVLCLSGCEDNKIDDGLEKQVTEKGKELENCKAYIDYAPGPGRYLTDYASGVIRKDGDATGITVNTVSGAVYLDR